MANIGAFNPATAPDRKSFEALPSGWYNVMIVGSEIKPTKAGTGHLLELELEVIDGEFAKRKVWDRLNLDNPNPQAVEIAYGTLKEICKATNTLHQIGDSSELHGKPMMARVLKKAATEQYDEGNDVKQYKPIGAGNGAQAGAATQTPPWQAPAAQVVPPVPAVVVAPAYPPEAIAWAQANAAHPEAQKILQTIKAPPPPPPAWTPPAPAPAPAAHIPPWQTASANPPAPAAPAAPAWTPPAAPTAATAPSAAKPPWQK